jgi:hypothetical protein
VHAEIGPATALRRLYCTLPHSFLGGEGGEGGRGAGELRGAVLAMELPKRHAASLLGSQSGYSEYSQWALTVGPQRTHSGYSEYSQKGLFGTRSSRRDTLATALRRQACRCTGAEFPKHTQRVL